MLCIYQEFKISCLFLNSQVINALIFLCLLNLPQKAIKGQLNLSNDEWLVLSFSPKEQFLFFFIFFLTLGEEQFFLPT